MGERRRVNSLAGMVDLHYQGEIRLLLHIRGHVTLRLSGVSLVLICPIVKIIENYSNQNWQDD